MSVTGDRRTPPATAEVAQKDARDALLIACVGIFMFGPILQPMAFMKASRARRRLVELGVVKGRDLARAAQVIACAYGLFFVSAMMYAVAGRPREPVLAEHPPPQVDAAVVVLPEFIVRLRPGAEQLSLAPGHAFFLEGARGETVVVTAFHLFNELNAEGGDFTAAVLEARLRSHRRERLPGVAGPLLEVPGARAVDGQSASHDVAVLQIGTVSPTARLRLAARPPSRGEPVWIFAGIRDRPGIALQPATVLDPGERAGVQSYRFHERLWDIRGTSGSPVLDARGDVVGLNVASDDDGSTGFAVPLGHLRRRLEEARPGGPARHAPVADWLRAVESEDTQSRWSSLLADLDKDPPSELAVTPQTEALIAAWQKRAPALRDAQRDGEDTCGSWVGAPAYTLRRVQGVGLLVLLGKSRSDRAREELRAAALHLKDPTLLLFTVQSLLQLGETPEATTVERALASDGQRAQILTVLQEHGRLDLAPARWRTQDSLARSVLAHWVRDDSEVRCFPPKIELLAVVPEGERDAYVYRFKTRSDKEAPWLAGLAGLFPRGADPSAKPTEGTLSDFEPAESAEPAQHAARLLALLRAENERRAQETSRADAGAR